ncbi:MAG: ABC transporter permease subunit, partial [Zavarzinia sp.]|nr:ABC transporter permease subunit [Zavarzinia sp.]
MSDASLDRPSALRRLAAGVEPWRDGVTSVTALLLLFLVVVPLVLLVIGSVAGTEGVTVSRYGEIFASERTYRLLLNSVIYAAGVATIALIVGGSTAWLIQRTDVPGKGLFVFLVLAPAFMPPVLLIMSWILMLDGNIGAINRLLQGVLGLDGAPIDIYSLGGMIWVGGLLDVPLAFLWLWPAFAAMDPSLEEAAAMSRAGPWRSLRTVTLPLVWPAMAAAFLISFVMAIEDVTVPILVGLPGRVGVFATDIYLTQTQIPPDSVLASAQSVILLVLTIVMMMGYRRLMRKSERFAVVRGKGYRPAPVPLGRARPFATVYLALLALVSVGLPFLILIWTSLSPFLQVPSIAGLSRLSF